MAGTWLNYPLDEEIFVQTWESFPVTVKTALLESGAVVQDSLIAQALQGQGNLYTIPYYMPLTGEPVNYNGQTDIPQTETFAGSQTGCAYGRAQGFTVQDFVAELSGADPMGHVAASIAEFWAVYLVKLIIALQCGLHGVTGDAEWAGHSVDLSDEANPFRIGETTLGDVATQVLGDQRDRLSLAIMHSQVAHELEKKQQLEYWKRTDALGIQRPLTMASVNGMTLIISDLVPVDTSGAAPKYTTLLLGQGAFRYAKGRVDVPVEVARDALKKGGQDTLVTRNREALHPNGFTFTPPTSGWTQSPTDAQLCAPARWKRVHEAKAIPMVRMITNG